MVSVAHFTFLDLAHESIVLLTVLIIPNPLFPPIPSHFSTRLHIVFIVWLSIRPALELQLQTKANTEIYKDIFYSIESP